MPSRNITKVQVSNSYYHVYARGINKQQIFVDVSDYKYFMSLIDRYLSQKPLVSKTGEIYPNFLDKVDIIAFCLMPNHFHLLIYQHDLPSLEKFMRSLMTSYSRYFNLRHKRTGSLFESRYKAVMIDEESYLLHVSRYIHLNPRRWVSYKYSSCKYYLNGRGPSWLKAYRVLAQFESNDKYYEFVKDYEAEHKSLREIKHLLIDEC